MVYTVRTAGGLALTMTALMVAVFTVSVGYGIVLPLLPELIERLLGAVAEAAPGWELGKQAAASSLEFTLGSAAGGLLFAVVALPDAAFVLTAALALFGFVLSLKLPRLLVPS
jgi:hypothetical protein